MNRILTVTTGSRDVQLRQITEDQWNTGVFEYSVPEGGKRSVGVMPHIDHPGILLLSSMRNGCLQLAQDYSLIREHLVMPLIEPAVKYVLENAGDIDLLLFVVTNQEKESVKEWFRAKDTVNLPVLAEKYLSEKFPGRIAAFDTYKVDEKATDIDFWYDRFKDDFRKKILIEESQGEAEVWFMPQGGLDQVNQALTLRFIEHWPDLRLLQVAEDSKPRLLEFPGKFLRNVTRAKAIEMAKYFRFNQVLDLNISGDKRIKLLAEAGDCLRRLDFMELVNNSQKEPYVSGKKEIPLLRKVFYEYVETLNAGKINKLLYLSAKISAVSRNTDEFLWRLSALGEQLLKPMIISWIGWNLYNEEEPFLNFNDCIRYNDDLMIFLEKRRAVPRTGCFIPSAAIFEKIKEYYVKQGKKLPADFNEIQNILTKLRGDRNLLVHQGKASGYDALGELLKKKYQISVEELFRTKLDPFFGLSGFEIFGELRDEIIRIL